ncbi:MAG: ATP-dependent sacrificial sulfur transferase LarE [Clostridia bacterium]|jgi:uncharacterized protein|nr:ATP-dependent sacrificial sulfur transferase LarE [Clostridia bacterium]MBQ5957452.1 ATP-dependent sacrificial sulfur transferase LarE [Clostridia bacterium]MBQ6004054.1 ATP-dependent sacrificial sulfur transferase LarE [Clostridia bacterium]MBR6821850.1 ATP-dependent sacrificial sulfur transferase LarE [Clostridia bacterium]
MHKKYKALIETIKAYDKVAVCLSGGSSSALVALAAVEALGKEKVEAITASTPFFTGEELLSCKELCKRLDVRLHISSASILTNPYVVSNGPERCYYCKKCMMDAINREAIGMGVDAILDGTCYQTDPDSNNERVLGEFGIKCPLVGSEITKEDVRDILDELSMSYYSKPENACLATRISTGEPITLKKLRIVRAAENYIKSLGYAVVRVRIRDLDGRIEVGKEEVEELMEQQDEIISEMKELGFRNVSIDPEGYRRTPATCL